MGLYFSPFSLKPETQGIVYLAHFDKPYSGRRHYLGWTVDLKKRIESHRLGTTEKGAEIIASLKKVGIDWRIVRTWEQKTMQDETRMKQNKNLKRLCPICSPALVEYLFSMEEAGNPAERRDV